MSRSGYSDEYDDNWRLICWRGAVASAIRGKRGQAFLREMLNALDALETKRLIGDEIVTTYGDVCAIGAVGVARGIPDLGGIDPDDLDTIAGIFGISPALAAEIMYMNDEAYSYRQSPAQRFARMRAWVIENIKAGADGESITP